MPAIGEIRKAKEIGYKRDCKYIWQACVDCRKERWVQLVNGKPDTQRCKACAAKARPKGICGFGQGVNNPSWKGGRRISGQGYILIKLEPDDFFYPMAGKNGCVMEHRLVMARHLHKCLLPWQVVHHRNGNVKDNRLENLEVLPCRGKHNTAMNKRIKELGRRVEKQAIEIKVLRFQVQELENKEVNVASIQ
jgi:hypothetical protein